MCQSVVTQDRSYYKGKSQIFGDCLEFPMVQFYAGIESPESLLAKLKNLKHSASSADNNFFACVVQTLFDEYRFFPEYPEAERNLTATLNTGLITEGLLEDFELGEAFRLLLSAVERAKGDLLCEYACKVLRAVTKQIVDFSQIRQHLLQVVCRFPS